MTVKVRFIRRLAKGQICAEFALASFAVLLTVSAANAQTAQSTAGQPQPAADWLTAAGGKMAFEVASVCLKAGAKRFNAIDEGRRAQAPAANPVTNIPVSAPSAQPVMTQSAPVHETPVPQSANPKEPPSDWLKPKIF